MDKSIETVKEKLIELGYFKYTKPQKLKKVIEETFENYNGDGVINFVWDDLNRVFSIDAEAICEGDGFKDQIKKMLPIFRAMGMNLKIGKYIEKFDDDGYAERTIEINKVVYDVTDSSDWGAASKAGIRLIDEILEDFEKTERVFILWEDEASAFILLDDKLHSYLDELIPLGAEIRPLLTNGTRFKTFIL